MHPLHIPLHHLDECPTLLGTQKTSIIAIFQEFLSLACGSIGILVSNDVENTKLGLVKLTKLNQKAEAIERTRESNVLAHQVLRPWQPETAQICNRDGFGIHAAGSRRDM